MSRERTAFRPGRRAELRQVHIIQRADGRAKTANYAGVAVERRRGQFTTAQGQTIELLDLPGIYGLTTRSLDERISVDTIMGRNAGDIRTQLHFILARWTR